MGEAAVDKSTAWLDEPLDDGGLDESWLDDGAKADDTSWLDSASDDEGAEVSVESSVKLTHEHQRAPTMMRGALPKTRVWACDGEYVYFRRKSAEKNGNQAILRRHASFMESGEYEHVGNQDDVEIYKLKPGSTFWRRPLNLYEMQIPFIRRWAILSACNRDWGLYVDCIEELASRLKGMFHADHASVQYQDALGYIEYMVSVRGGPSVHEMNRGFQSVMQRRGQGRGKVLLIPPKSTIVH